MAEIVSVPIDILDPSRSVEDDTLILVNPEPSPLKAVADTVPDVLTRVTNSDPNCIVLLVLTIAFAPMAVEFTTCMGFSSELSETISAPEPKRVIS